MATKLPQRPYPKLSIAVASLLLGAAACNWDQFEPNSGGAGGEAASSTAATNSGGTSTTSAGGAGGSGGTGGNQPGPPCMGFELFSDDFAGPPIHPYWATAGLTAENAGLEFSINNLSGQRTATYLTHPYFRMDAGDSLTAEVSQGPTPTTEPARLEFGIERSNTVRLTLAVSGTTLSLRQTYSSGVNVYGSVTYSPMAHRYLRLRVEGEEVVGEGSPDDVSYVEVGRVAQHSVFPLDEVRIRAYLIREASLTVAVSAKIRAVFGNSNVANQFCRPRDLVDDFSDTLHSPWWHGSTIINAYFSEVGGRLTFTPFANADSTAFYASASGYDLDEDGFSVRVERVLEEGETALRAGQGRDTWAGITHNGGNLDFGYRLPEAPLPVLVSSVDYDPVAHAYWRLRADAADLIFETSPDAIDWITNAIPRPPGLSLSGVRAMLYTRANLAVAPGVAQFDDFNVVPPSGP